MSWKENIDNEFIRNDENSKFSDAWENKKASILEVLKSDFISYFEENGSIVEHRPDSHFGQSCIAKYKDKKILFKLENAGLILNVDKDSIPGYYCEIIMDYPYNTNNNIYSVVVELKDKIKLDYDIDKKIELLNRSNLTFGVFKKDTFNPIMGKYERYNSFYEALKTEL